MQKFKSIFKKDKPVIGMIHVKALPGTPKHSLDSSHIIAQALKEAQVYKKAGIDSIMIENMHDIPYIKGISVPSLYLVVTRFSAIQT